jgi:hypothetical protein
MQAPEQSEAATQIKGHPAASAGLVYDLRLKDDRSDHFYNEAARFSDRLLTAIDFRAAPLTGAYASYVQNEKRESPRSHAEYALEFLMLGLVLRFGSGVHAWRPRWQLPGARERCGYAVHCL